MPIATQFTEDDQLPTLTQVFIAHRRVRSFCRRNIKHQNPTGFSMRFLCALGKEGVYAGGSIHPIIFNLEVPLMKNPSIRPESKIGALLYFRGLIS